MLLTEQVLPHGLKLLGMEGTRIGMLKCQGWEIEWFGGLDDWDLRGAKAFRNIYNAWWHIYTFSFHQNDHTMYERHFWSHWSWKSYRIMDLLENLGILILWDALISWATPIVFVHQTHHFHISQSWKEYNKTPHVLGNRSQERRRGRALSINAAVFGGGHEGRLLRRVEELGTEVLLWRGYRQLCAKGDRLNFWRKYLRLKALVICRKHVGFGSKGWLKLVGSTIFFEKVLEQVDMQCIPSDLSVAFRLWW